MIVQKHRNFHKTYKTWEIPDINQLLERADRNGPENPVTLDKDFSEEFRGHKIEWKVVLKISSLNLFPGGLSLSFIPVSGMDDDTCNFYLVDIDENHLYIGLSDQSTYNNREDPDFVPYRFQRKKEELLAHNSMILLIEVFSYWDWDRYPMVPRPELAPIEAPKIEVPIDYFELYSSPEKSGDVVVVQVQDSNFTVHKDLLEKKCPVLYEDVVRHQQISNSNKNSELTLTDIDPKIFKKVVEFIYTDKVCNLDDHSEYLLEAADKYKLIRLKKLCEQSLGYKYLSYRNAPAIYDLAIRCDASQLKKAALIVRPSIENPKLGPDVRKSIAEYRNVMGGSFTITLD